MNLYRIPDATDQMILSEPVPRAALLLFFSSALNDAKETPGKIHAIPINEQKRSVG